MPPAAVLDPHPRKRRRGRPEALKGLAALAGEDPAARIAVLLEDAGYSGLSAVQLFARTGLPEKQLQRTLEVMSSRGEAVLFDKERRAYASPAVLQRLSEKTLAAVRAHRQAEPLAPGLPREELRQRLGEALEPRLFARLLGALAEKGSLLIEGDVVREKGEPVAMAKGDEELKDQIARSLAESGLCPPYLDELGRRVHAPPAKVAGVVKMLEKEGRAVRVSPDMYFDAAAVEALRQKLVAFLRERQRITTQEFKELVAATRKYTIPLSEYFDREKVTLRVGEVRVLRGAAAGRPRE